MLCKKRAELGDSARLAIRWATKLLRLLSFHHQSRQRFERRGGGRGVHAIHHQKDQRAILDTGKPIEQDSVANTRLLVAMLYMTSAPTYGHRKLEP